MIYLADVSNFKEDFFEKAVLLLPDEKRSHILGITNEKAKKESTLAWILLWFALAQNGISHFPNLKFSEREKPSFEKSDIFFNLSHSEKKVCAAFSFEADIGVDIQVVSNFSDKMKKRVFCENELAVAESFEDSNRYFTKLWAIKESFLKNTGIGIAFDLKSLDFSKNIKNVFFGTDDLFYSVFSLETYELSVCSSEKEKQQLINVSGSELVEFVK